MVLGIAFDFSAGQRKKKVQSMHSDVIFLLAFGQPSAEIVLANENAKLQKARPFTPWSGLKGRTLFTVLNYRV